MYLKVLFCVIVMFCFFPSCSAAHYVVGIVNDALDGTNANDHEVVLWNPVNGISDNLTDIIGVNGNSNADHVYMIDCEMLVTPCSIGDELSVMVYNTGDGYISKNVSVSVSGSGFDAVSNITLNSPPSISSVIVDDDLLVPVNEVDLITNGQRQVTCEGIVEEFDGDDLQNVSAEFFDEVVSFYGDFEDNNSHYTNSSCFVNSSYGNENQSKIFCGFGVWYYANSENWRCVLDVADNLTSFSNDSDGVFINSLLSIEVNSSLDFGEVSVNVVSSESVMNITNFGNVEVNLSLFGYGASEGDGFSMNCSGLSNISIDYKKYNLTNSVPGELSFAEFEENYENLTSALIVKDFGLDYRQQEDFNEAVRSTYWRIYVPSDITGSCSGNIVVGAAVGVGS